MRNYRFGSDLRQNAQSGEEPELQWLEDSINFLCALIFASVCGLCKIFFNVVLAFFRSFTQTKI